ncbi:MAG: glycosyltransferase [Prevotella sp.]|nr:glycosyltransferase [Candidatus Prevotella equi]
MRIVHYISDITSNAGPIAGSVQMMMACTAKVVETHFITNVALSQEDAIVWKERYGVAIHYLPPIADKNPIALISVYQNIRKTLQEIKPDVVHVHGAWNVLAAMVEHAARHSNIVTIVSPHRALSPEIINIDFWKKKLWRLLAYQIWMVRFCTAVIAMNEKEKENIISLGLKKRIEVLPTIPRDLESAGPVRDAMMATYRKALDTMYYKHITDAEKDFVATMVQATAIDKDVELRAPKTEGLSFRNIFFYAYDEDVTEQMMIGAHKMGVAIPTLMEVEKVPRYKIRKAKVRSSINNVNNSKRHKISEEYKMEQVAVDQIAKAKSLGMKRMTLRNYLELYRLFRNTDFNEDIVAEELKRMGLKSFTIKLQKKLTKMFALKEGYNIY